MKNRNIFIHSLIGLLAVSCTVQEPDIQLSPIIEEPVEEDVFYASLESDSMPETKVYVDGSATNLKMHWDAEDQLSISISLRVRPEILPAILPAFPIPPEQGMIWISSTRSILIRNQ